MNASFNFNQRTLKLALVSALALGGATISGYSVAATATGGVTVGATLASACEASSDATISFGSIANLVNNPANIIADSAGTFQVACSAGSVPLIYTTAPHVMLNGASPLPFNLSLVSGAPSDTLLTNPTALDLVMDGTPQTVTLYAKISAANLAGLPNGSYSQAVIVNVDY